MAVGWAVTGTFLWGLRKYFDVEKSNDEKTVPPWLTGLIERLFFTIVVAVNLPGAAIAMITWVTVKMATHWNKVSSSDIPNGRFLVFSGLLAGLVSMLFAMLGGLIIRHGV